MSVLGVDLEGDWHKLSKIEDFRKDLITRCNTGDAGGK